MDIDIGAKLVPDDCTVWRLFPGQSYRLLEHFFDLKVASLELPGLELPITNLGESNSLLARILASQDIITQRIEHGPDHVLRSDWRDFAEARNTQARGRLRQSVINFYSIAKKGDLIVMPSPKNIGEFYIGEFLDPPEKRQTISGIQWYGDHEFVGRNVRWFPARAEDAVSPKLSSILRHPNPFSPVDARLYNEVLSLAYENFIWNGMYGSSVFNGNDNFLDTDNTLIGIIFKISAYACFADDQGEKTIEINDIFDFLITNPPLEYACYYSAENHSPGYARFFAPKPTPLVATTVIAGLLFLGGIADAGERDQAAAELAYVNRRNSHDADCDPPISNAAAIVFRSLRGEQLRKACESMLSSKERAELRVRSRPVRRRVRPE